MSNIRVNSTQAIPPTKSSTSGYSNGDRNKNGNKDKYNGPTFHDIFEQKREELVFQYTYILR